MAELFGWVESFYRWSWWGCGPPPRPRDEAGQWRPRGSHGSGSPAQSAPDRIGIAGLLNSDRNRRFDAGMRVVAGQLKVAILELVDVPHGGVQFHLRQRARLTR